MKIEFYVPENEKIPTQLRLKVGEKQIIYERVGNDFVYDFFVNGCELSEAMSIVEEIALSMCDQSYDHGSSWRIVSIKEVNDEQRYVDLIIRVNFRIRDAW